MDLSNSFKGNDIKIRVNKRLDEYGGIVSVLENAGIQCATYLPSISTPPPTLSISYGNQTDFSDLRLLVSLLVKFKIHLIYYSHEDDNLVTIGTYANESRSDEDMLFFYHFDFKTEGLSPSDVLCLPSSTSTKELLRNRYNILINQLDQNLNKWISENYHIQNPNECGHEEAKRVNELSCKNQSIKTLNGLEKFDFLERIYLSDNKIHVFNLTPFPKLTALDCSYNPIASLDIKTNTELEYIRYEAIRGNTLGTIDFSGNPKLKKIIGGQDGLTRIDLSNNSEVEDIDIRLSQHLRFIDVRSCLNLKRIRLWGVLIPFVDLTKNEKLEYVEINYLNNFKDKKDEFGPGYPRPFIFVNENFNNNTIHSKDLLAESYTHFLVRVRPFSKEEKILQELNSLDLSSLGVPNVASFHYKTRAKLGY